MSSENGTKYFLCFAKRICRFGCAHIRNRMESKENETKGKSSSQPSHFKCVRKIHARTIIPSTALNAHKCHYILTENYVRYDLQTINHITITNKPTKKRETNETNEGYEKCYYRVLLVSLTYIPYYLVRIDWWCVYDGSQCDSCDKDVERLTMK